MAGGMRIDDHKFFAGGPSKGSVFPEGVHTKNESTAEGAGGVMKYEDTTEAIRTAQMAGEKKIKGRPMTDSNRY
jgi:hypothetical protein